MSQSETGYYQQGLGFFYSIGYTGGTLGPNGIALGVGYQASAVVAAQAGITATISLGDNILGNPFSYDDFDFPVVDLTWSNNVFVGVATPTGTPVVAAGAMWSPKDGSWFGNFGLGLADVFEHGGYVIFTPDPSVPSLPGVSPTVAGTMENARALDRASVAGYSGRYSGLGGLASPSEDGPGPGASLRTPDLMADARALDRASTPGYSGPGAGPYSGLGGRDSPSEQGRGPGAGAGEGPGYGGGNRDGTGYGGRGTSADTPAEGGPGPGMGGGDRRGGTDYTGPGTGRDSPREGGPGPGNRPSPGLTTGPGGRVAGSVPVLIDLVGDGFDVNPLHESSFFADLDGSGFQSRMAWAGEGTGVLVLDADGDGRISGIQEVAFTEWDPSASSDLEALDHVFDTNANGMLDAGDARWSEFKVSVNG